MRNSIIAALVIWLQLPRNGAVAQVAADNRNSYIRIGWGYRVQMLDRVETYGGFNPFVSRHVANLCILSGYDREIWKGFSVYSGMEFGYYRSYFELLIPKENFTFAFANDERGVYPRGPFSGFQIPHASLFLH